MDTEIETRMLLIDRKCTVACIAVKNNIDIHQGPPTKSEGPIYETATE